MPCPEGGTKTYFEAAGWTLSLRPASSLPGLRHGGGGSGVRLWSTKDGALLQALRGHTKPVHGLAFGTKDDTVVSAADDCKVRLWDPAGALFRRSETGSAAGGARTGTGQGVPPSKRRGPGT